MIATRRSTGILVAAVVLVALVSGCSLLTPDALPSAQVFRSGWTLKVELGTVVNLPPQTRAQVDGTDAGVLRSVSAHGGVATVTLTINKGVTVDQNASAVVRQDTLLGDTYISIDNPTTRSAAIPTGGTLTRQHAKDPVQIEDLFHDLANFLGSGSLAQLGGTVSYINGQFPANPDDIRRAQKPLLEILNTFANDTNNGNKLLTGFSDISEQLATQKRSLAFLLSKNGAQEIEGITDSVIGYADVLANISTAVRPIVPLSPALRSLGDVVNSVVIPFLVPGWPNYRGQRSNAANLEDLLRTKLIPFFEKSPKVNIRTLMVKGGLSDRDISGQMVRTLRMMGLTR